MFFYKKGKLHCEDVPIEEIALSAGTPVYIYSKNKIIKNLKEYQQAFNSVDSLLCYAVKANSNYSICKTIFDCGAGADVASSGELFRVLNAGVSPQKVVFAGVGKTKEEIEFGIRKKILLFNVESVEELKLINQLAGEVAGRRHSSALSGKVKVKIALRINPNIDPHTHKYITTGKKENKFGIPYESAIEVIKFAFRECPNLSVCGIHCHIGSQIEDIKPFELMARKIAKLIERLQKNFPYIKLEYVDIGGGLGIKYHNENPPTPKELSKTVLSILRKYKLKFITEPGRYIVGNAGILVTKVLYIKHGRYKNFVIVDAGMNDLIRPTLYGACHEILPVNHARSSMENVDVVGPICESGDFFALDRKMYKVHSSDLIAVMCAGAYGAAMSSQYNSRRRAAEVLVDGKHWKVIREREKYIDLVRNEKH